MKKILLISSLLFTLTAGAQTYQKIETTRFNKDGQPKTMLTKYQTGKIVIGETFINVEGQPTFTIVRKGTIEPQDELYTCQEYLCITEDTKGRIKAFKCVLFYTPKKQLCDVVVKNGRSNIDYCIKD